MPYFILLYSFLFGKVMEFRQIFKGTLKMLISMYFTRLERYRRYHVATSYERLPVQNRGREAIIGKLNLLLLTIT